MVLLSMIPTEQFGLLDETNGGHAEIASIAERSHWQRHWRVAFCAGSSSGEARDGESAGGGATGIKQRAQHSPNGADAQAAAARVKAHTKGNASTAVGRSRPASCTTTSVGEEGNDAPKKCRNCGLGHHEKRKEHQRPHRVQTSGISPLSQRQWERPDGTSCKRKGHTIM